jgi:hypothetical protein
MAAIKPDERLIILLPPDLLEEVRRAAEEEDLSVSQIVRRALRNELKAISDKAVPGLAITLENIGRLFQDAQNKGALIGSATHGDLIPGAPHEKISATETATIVRRKKKKKKKQPR